MTILTDSEVVEPTMTLRWAQCGTERVLQQQFVIKRLNSRGQVTGMGIEWRNIAEATVKAAAQD